MRGAYFVIVAAIVLLPAGCTEINPRDKTPELSQTEQNRAMRRHARELRASREFRRALVEEEGMREQVYRDVAGYATVGVGHLVRSEDRLRVGDRVNRKRIARFLEDDIRKAERSVAKVVGDLPLHQHEFDALLDLVYNVGEGNVSPHRSPRLNRAIRSRDYEGIARELRYTTAKGARAAGLVFRSARRQRMFKEGKYDNPRSNES